MTIKREFFYESFYGNIHVEKRILRGTKWHVLLVILTLHLTHSYVRLSMQCPQMISAAAILNFISQKLLQKARHLLHALLHNLFVILEFLFESIETSFRCELFLRRVRRVRRVDRESERMLYDMRAVEFRRRVGFALQQPWFLRLIIKVAGNAHVFVYASVSI